MALEASLIVGQDPAQLEQRAMWVDELEALASAGEVSSLTSARWAHGVIEATRGDAEQAIATLTSVRLDQRLADHPYALQVAAQGDVLDTFRRRDWDGARAALTAGRERADACWSTPRRQCWPTRVRRA